MPTPAFPTLEHLTTAIILLDDESRIAYLNPAAEHAFGLSNSNLIGHPLQHAFTQTEQLFAAIQSALASHSSHIEHEMLLGTHTLGNRLHLSCTATPLQLDGYALLLEFHAIDRPRKLAREEQMLDQTQANRLLLRNLAHEIRNPLAAIAQANALLGEDLAEPRHQQLIQMVTQNANRLGKIVDEILNISRVQAQDNTASAPSLALSESAARICRDWALQTGSEQMTRVQMLSPDLQVAFEGEHLRRVLINLLDNARRYASGKPEAIQIDTRSNASGQGILCVWSDGQPLEQSVERHLFEPFFSSESRSSGLGLYICRELCEGHGASIAYHRTRRTMGEADTDGNEFIVRFRTARASERTRSGDAAISAAPF